MDRQDNPFFNFLEIISKLQNISANYMEGKVTSTNPLMVEAGGIQLERDDLLINKDLLKGTKRNIKINGVLNIIENVEDCFSIGDSVILLMSQDQQQYVLLCIAM